MSDIILHHYPASPFAEKIRCILGAKQLSWKSVIIPRIMPKPDVVALTGGYRKTPILQIGANIICDTALIARKLNAMAPMPDLYPSHAGMSVEAIAAWADAALFQAAVPLAFLPEVLAQTYAGREAEMQAFVADRAAMRKGSPSPRLPLTEAKNNFTLFINNLEKQLALGSAFLFGNSPTIADFSVYHPLWFIATKPVVGEIFNAYPNIQQWMTNIQALGHGHSTEITSAEALAIASGSKVVISGEGSALPELKPGDTIVACPTDYGMDPVQGTLLYCNEHEVVLARKDERAGNVAVHFPRANYSIKKAES
ncbi:MAG: glutathione S-transferase family protein [Gammaproteobacteria bacterium]|nr:glutathione S-transferase family protein [Gammaproteobacteria bacterium]